jgi:hypothetical protein
MPHTLNFTLPAVLPEPLRGHLQMGGTNPAGDCISVNSRWLEWNGKPWLPIMGEFHPTRYDERFWEEELLKIKAGGITTVAAYLFWNHHEEVEGEFDWTGRRDIRRFIGLCAKAGLQVLLRIGPFCHGEVRNGGMPDWLYGKPYEVRSNDPRYLFHVERLYREIFQQAKGSFFTDGGPVVGIQVENEYLSTGAPWETTHFPDTEWMTAGAGGDGHMELLLELAKKVGFAPALWTCTGWGNTRFPADHLIPMFGGYAYYGWQDDGETTHECSPNFVFRDMWNQPHEQPLGKFDTSRVPYACCEIGGGMQQYYRHRPVVPPASVGAMNTVILGNGSNIMGTYVYHGGLNPEGGRSWLGEFRVPRLSYDYQAPLGEFGQRRPHYDMLRRIYYFIQRAQEQLAIAAPQLPSDQALVIPADTDSLRAAVRADAHGRGYLFLNNFQDHAQVPPKPDTRIAVLTPDGETLSFPAAGRFDFAPESSYILPFNFDLAGIALKQGGTQFITSRKDQNATEHFFFFAPKGMEKPHYLFRGAVDVEGAPAETTGTDTLVSVPSAQRSSFVVKTGAASARITTLTESESLDFWQDRCASRQVTLLTKAGVIFHEDGIELYQLGDPRFQFELLDDQEVSPKSEIALKKTAGRDGFVGFEAEVPSWNGSITSTELKSGKVHVTFSEGAFENIHDLFLRTRYRGDTGMAFVSGRMVHDNFQAGNPWEIGLRQFLPEAAVEGVVLRVVPNPVEGGSCTQDAMGAGAINGGDFKDIGFDYIEAIPEYRLRVRFPA